MDRLYHNDIIDAMKSPPEYGSLDSLSWWINKKLKIDISGIDCLNDLWEYISRNVNLPEEFIVEFKDYLDWRLISQFQNLDERFMIRFVNKLHLSLIETYQNVSSKFIERLNLDTSNNWKIKDTYTKIKLLSNLGFKCYKGGFMGKTYDPIVYHGFYKDSKYIDIEVMYGLKNEIPYGKNRVMYNCLARYEDIFWGPNIELLSDTGVEVTNAFIFNKNGLFTNSLLRKDYKMIDDIFKLNEGLIWTD
jgi:hypothetical protein